MICKFQNIFFVTILTVVFSVSGCGSFSINDIAEKVNIFKPSKEIRKIKSISKKDNANEANVVIRKESVFSPLKQRFLPDEVPALPANSPIDLSGKRVEFTASQILDCGDYASFLLGSMDYGKRKDAFNKLLSTPDKKAEYAMILVLQTRDDPFSRFAVQILAQLNTERADQAILDALSDPRPTIRASALLVLVEKKKPGAGKLCHEALAMDRTGIVKCAAAVGIGGLRYEAARGTLHMAVQKAVPMVRLFSAWALYELGDEKGRDFIENVAYARDDNLSPQAMTIIALFKDKKAVDALLSLLGSDKISIWATAYKALLSMPKGLLVGKLDIPYPELKEGRRFMNTIQRKRRRAALLAIELGLQGSERIIQARYSLLNQFVSSGTATELRMMSRVIASRLSNRAIEPLIRSLSFTDNSIVEANKNILRKISEKYSLSGVPDNSQGKEAWRIWWIKNCSARMVKDSRSRKLIVVIKSPDGIDYFAAAGVMIVPGVTVAEVQKKFREGLKLSVNFSNRKYLIQEK